MNAHKSKLIVGVLIFVFLAYAFVIFTHSRPQIPPPAGVYFAYPSELLTLTNQDRASTSPLLNSNTLNAAAEIRGIELCTQAFSHDGWEKQFDNLPYTHIGENIARNYQDETLINYAFMASPDHRKNILDPNFSEMGSSDIQCGSYTQYGTKSVVVELFGGYYD